MESSHWCKLLNVREANPKQIMENTEIQQIKQILGLQHEKEYDSVKSLRYGHLMIMTDQGHDGSHIKGLIINFIHSFWPSLLKVLSFLVEFITPIMKAKATNKNERVLSFYSMPEYELWKESLGTHATGWSIKYYKGLGTSTSKEGKEYFSDLAKHKKDFIWVDEQDGEAIELAFSKKKIEAWKNWLRQFEPGTYLDQKEKLIKYSDFVNKELILFSMADLQRSIPSMVDGLKPGQRKILFCSFKKNLVKENKVAQFSGYVSEHSAYHHGEQSLASTIVGMAQDYVGSNDINLLMPNGQFGTRSQGGKDHVSARYIYTCLSPLTRFLFPKDDDILLDYLNEDGQSIEPFWYIPILPLVLVDGSELSEGIGTGWSSYVSNYNPMDIVENLRRLLNDEPMQPMDPWYKGFKWLTGRRKKALFEALEKVKAELMVLGFISLLLTFGQNYIARVCISEKAASTMLPCLLNNGPVEEEAGGNHRRRILWDATMDSNSTRRVLAAGASSSTCPQGKAPLVSLHGLHQLHIFIFFLAVFHVAHSALTMALGRAKIRRWKKWEKETSSPNYEFSSDPSRFRFPQEIPFVRQHTSFWNRNSILLYIVSFFHQFFRSVRKTDYLAMRNVFITEHLAPGSKFNFQKYIKRSLEDDFKVVVGISPILWVSAVIFLLLNVTRWQTLFWVSLIPLTIIFAVGAKLWAIITKMAVEIQDKHTVVQGVPLVQLSDQHFWFERPHLVLFLIHFTLFQNAFQIIYFFWIWYEFGLKSCFHDNFKLIIARVCLGVGVQFLCSYITLPLYALVSQMGSNMKKSIFNEQTSKVIMKWHQAIKKRHRKGLSRSPSRSPGTTPRYSLNASAVHPLRRFKSTGLSDTSQYSPRRSYCDLDMSDAEADMQSFEQTNVESNCGTTAWR